MKLYKVIAGTFEQKEQASNRVSFLKDHDIEAFQSQIHLGGETYYRVQAGAFEQRSNAEPHLKVVQQWGIERAYLLQTFSNQIFRDVEIHGCCGAYFVRGEANVDNTLFDYAIEDGHRYLLEGSVQQETPTWSTFALQLWMPKDRIPLNGTLILELFERSSKNGEQTHFLPIVLESFH